MGAQGYRDSVGLWDGHTDSPSSRNHCAVTKHLCSAATEKSENQGHVLLSTKPYAAWFRTQTAVHTCSLS